MNDEKTVLENKVFLLKEQVTNFQKQLNIIREASNKLKKIRLYSGVAVGCIILIFIFGLYVKISRFDIAKTEEIILKDLSGDLPIFASKVVDMSERVVPVYLKQFSIKAEEVKPEFLDTLQRESLEFTEYLEKVTVEKVRKGVVTALESQEGVICNFVPELKDENNLILLTENLRDILRVALLNVTIDKFETHIKAIEEVETTLSKLRVQFKDKEERDAELKLMSVAFEMIGKKLAKDIESSK